MSLSNPIESAALPLALTQPNPAASMRGIMKTLLSVVFLALTPLLHAAELSETKKSVPRLPAAVAYQPADNTIVVELSEYAGYGGLIVANGGLEANENSV